jgi:hypothetical protein
MLMLALKWVTYAIWSISAISLREQLPIELRYDEVAYGDKDAKIQGTHSENESL